MKERHRVYVICRNGGDPCTPHDYCCYAAHGEKGGVTDAIGYDEAAHAQKFRCAKDAKEYICHRMPEWGRSSHHVSELNPLNILLAGLPLYAAMCNPDEPIPDALLEHTKDRLLIWRR